MFKFLGLFILFVLSPPAIAQIVINEEDMPNTGDTIRLSSTYDISGINFEETGPNFFWDFSALQPLVQRVDTFVSVQETPWVYQLIFFLSANLAKKQIEFDQFPGFEVTDVYEYFKKSSSDFRSVGFGLTLNSIPIPNKFNEPDLIYQFPLAYGNEDSSLAQYEIAIPGIGYSGGWKKRVNHVDGWGTLQTPFGSFETIRVKSDVVQYDSIHIDSLGFGLPFYRTFAEYKWLGNNWGLPLMTIIDDGLLPSIVYIDSVRAVMINESIEYSENFRIHVYPNPTSSKITLSFLNPVDESIPISIFSGSGKLIRELEVIDPALNNTILSVDMKEYGLQSGLYFIQVNTGVKSFIEKILLKD